MTEWHGGKGSRDRTKDRDKFNESFEKIFMGITPEIKIESPLEILIPKENYFKNEFKINRSQKSFLFTMLPFELIIK